MMNRFRFLAILCCGLLAAGSLNAAEPLPWIRVNETGDGFIAGEMKTPFRPMGFNYDHDADGRLIEDYWHTEWDRVDNDFHDMQKLGANVVRVHLQFGRFMNSPTEPNQDELSQLTRLLKLAEETQLYLDLTGLGCYHKKDVPPWYDALDESARWKAQRVFWEAVAATCKDSSAVFCYDLMNEPVIGGEKAAGDWLGPAFGGKHFVQFVARSTNGRSRTEAAKQWIDQLVDAVRKHDQRHLITVGLVDWSLERPGLTSGFVPEKVTQNLDFLAIHLYPKTGKIDEALATLKGFQIGKPVIIEETFPLGCSLEDMEAFMDQAGDDADGWVSFFWGKMPDEYSSPTSIGEAVTSQWLTKFSERIKTEQSEQSKPKPQQDPKHVAAPVSAVVELFAQHALMHPDGTMPYTVDQDAWSEADSSLPIGVFDSGIGGLTVQQAILSLDAFHNETYSPGPDGRRDFEHERFIYFGDQANMPYGNYPTAERQDFLKELILKDAAFLLGRRYWPAADATEPKFDKPPVKAIVIACNTATAWGLDEIRQLIDAWKIPVFVIGVVDAGARGVADVLSADSPKRTVAVLATVGTCGSNAYPKAIGRTVGLSGKRVPDVIQQGSVGLAGAIEGDPAFVTEEPIPEKSGPVYLGPSVSNQVAPLDHQAMEFFSFEPTGLLGDQQRPETLRLNSVENYVRYDVTMLVRNHHATGQTAPIDTVVLGCTHFPLVKREILNAFADLRRFEKAGQRPFESFVAEKITVVDPAEMTAKELFRELARRKMFRTATAATESDLCDQFYISVANRQCPDAKRNADGSLTRDYKYGRSPGNLLIEDTINIPMTLSVLPASSRNLIQQRLPDVWTRLK
jgi:glutamate racemase